MTFMRTNYEKAEINQAAGDGCEDCNGQGCEECQWELPPGPPDCRICADEVVHCPECDPDWARDVRDDR